jgi:uncharacterized Ntn-hydrolase superfamily protein
MTFSIAGHCARTGMFAISISTSNPAVGSRCIFARAGVGAVLTQHRTDPRLGPRGLDFLAAGLPAKPALDAIIASTPHHAWRQLAVIDAQGHSAHYSGGNIRSVHAGVSGKDCVAIGNILRSDAVPAAMVKAFEADARPHIGERIMRALEAGLAAGGENDPVQSAALLVVDRTEFALVDLRVDLDPQPIPALRRLWDRFGPDAESYVTRAIDPDAAPGFGEIKTA